MALTANVIKKHVIQNADVKNSPVPLYVGERDGEMWATNRYWLTRAERVAPLLEQYNLSADGPGAYEVNGTVRPATGQYGISTVPPDFEKFIGNLKGYAPAVPVHIPGGGQAYTRQDRFGLYAAFLLADGTHAGLQADRLDWLSNTVTAPLPEGYRYGDIRVAFHKDAHGHVNAVISAEVFRIVERAHYEDEGRGAYVPVVEEACEPRMLGMMMGMSYGA